MVIASPHTLTDTTRTIATSVRAGGSSAILSTIGSCRYITTTMLLLALLRMANIDLPRSRNMQRLGSSGGKQWWGKILVAVITFTVVVVVVVVVLVAAFPSVLSMPLVVLVPFVRVAFVSMRRGRL